MLSKFVLFASSRRVLQRLSAFRLSCATQKCDFCSRPPVFFGHAFQTQDGGRLPVVHVKDVVTCSSLHNQKRNYCAAPVRQSEVTYEDLQALMRSNDIKLIDVREPQELTQFGRIEGSVNIPLSKLIEALKMSDETFTECYKCDKPQLHDTNIVFYGLGPIKSTAALELAFKLGFKKARHYKGGWVEYAQKSGQPEKKGSS